MIECKTNCCRCQKYGTCERSQERLFQKSTTFSASFFVLQIFAEVMPGTCNENNKLSEFETRSTDAKFLSFVRVEIAM